MHNRARKTAPLPHNFELTHDDIGLVSEALRVAALAMVDLAAQSAKYWPNSPLVERWNTSAERMTDLRTRIES